MPMTQYTGDTDIIANVGTTPQERGLTTDEFKAKFDEGLKAFVSWFNTTHKTEFDAHLNDLVTDTDGVHGLKIEEGTWTPTLAGASTAGTNTYTTRSAFYKKINKMVFFTFSIDLSTKDVAMAGNIRITGLPYTASSSYGVSIGHVGNTSIATQIMATIDHDTNYIQLMKYVQNSFSAGIVPADIASNFQIYASGFYFVN
jgi:hypothetical protein